MMGITTIMQPINGCKLLDMETEEVLAVGGLSPSPPVMPPPSPRAGLLAFKAAGGVPKLKKVDQIMQCD